MSVALWQLEVTTVSFPSSCLLWSVAVCSANTTRASLNAPTEHERELARDDGEH